MRGEDVEVLLLRVGMRVKSVFNHEKIEGHEE